MRESRWLPSLLEVFRVKRLWRPFFVSVGELALRLYFIVLIHLTHSCLRSTLQLVHFKGVHLSQVHQLINTCTNRSLFGAAETAAPPDPGKSRVSPGNYIAKINGVHREVMCWHLLSTTHAGCNTRELIPLWHLLGRLPLASRLAVAHGEVHR